MLSINKKKLIRLLQSKKRRDEYQLFVAEGQKLVTDLVRGGMQPFFFAASSECMTLPYVANALCEKALCSEHEMREVSHLKTPTGILAIFCKPGQSEIKCPSDLTLVLDEVQDPGNLGTIIRVADWFGIRQIWCSDTCADAFSPKTIQATMGAIARVQVTETDLVALMERNNRAWHVPVFGTFLEGDNIFQSQLPRAAFVVMGNEGKGISKKLAKYVSHKLFVPPYPPQGETSESLNVATATAVVCSEFRRRLQ